MSFIKAYAAVLAVGLVFAAPVSAQQQATPSNAATAAASALVEGTIPGVVDELAQQMPSVFQTSLGAELTAAQQTQLTARMAELPELIRQAMEQRWVAREPPQLPPGLQARMDEMMRATLAGRRGELGAVRPPTRDIVAVALAEKFSEAQLERIGVFLATPAGHALSHQFAVASVQRRAPDLSVFSASDLSAIREFAGTQEGQVYMEAAESTTQMVVEQLRLNTMTHGPELMLAFTGIVCEVLGPSCATIE